MQAGPECSSVRDYGGSMGLPVTARIPVQARIFHDWKLVDLLSWPEVIEQVQEPAYC